jgi:signal transduction histidine kinase
MKNRLKPVPRLTIVFILAVFLSGSVLTWFSINNIANFKELTEKRIREEQGEVASKVLSAIEGKLVNVTSGLSNGIFQQKNLKDPLVSIAGKFEFITHPFILNKSGKFLYPFFTGIHEYISTNNFSGTIASGFIAGEKAEFSEKNLPKAKDYFLSCLKNSSGSRDSAASLNALGRISIKLKESDRALIYYNLIITDFFLETDGNGILYIYYALPQLAKILNQDNSEKIIDAAEYCLAEMESGTIPLNFSTDELLTIIETSLKVYNLENKERKDKLTDLVNLIRRQSRFVITYGNELTEFLNKEKPENYPSAGNDFKIVSAVSGNVGEFFLINTESENPAGFLIDRNKFLEDILKTDLLSGLEFDYKLKLTSLNGSNSARQNLAIISQLTPWFPDHAIEIKLTNENLIKELVRRRSWIYGFATLLLLVAMCLGVILILRDIAMEGNLARLRSDFISNVTHELKTPLTSIRMYAESLLMGRVKTPDGQKEYLEVVVNESERLKRMINNILEFSKMEKGKPEYHYVNSNLAAILNSSIREMSYWLEKENFEVITQLDDNINADVDPEKMKQVIENLLSNAIKYSTEIKRIFIRLFRETDNIHIEVEDNGIGIPQDQLSRIFEPFYRIEQKDNISGTGLGLTVVKEIIEAHHGKIAVISKPGKGSKFVIELNQQVTKSEDNSGNRG